MATAAHSAHSGARVDVPAVSLPPDSHLLLGLTLSEIESFMRRIGWDPEDGPGAAYTRPADLNFVTAAHGAYDSAAAQSWKGMRQRNRERSNLEFETSKAMLQTGADHDRARELCARDPGLSFEDAIHQVMNVQEDMAMLKKRYAPIEKNWHSICTPSPLTGYDFAAAVRKWLQAEGKAHMSVCEVLQEEGCAGVGKANTFYSHMQRPCMTECVFRMKQAGLTFYATQASRRDLFGTESEPCFWLDYFTLRQCRADFNLPHIASAIDATSLTIAELDPGLEYLARSFCIFEVYATVAAKNKMFVNVIPDCSDDSEAPSLKERLGTQPVDCMRAQTLYKKDKEQIDRYIEREVGAAALNDVVSRAIREGQERRVLSRG